MQVKDIMTHTVEVVSPGTTLDEAAERMRALDIGVLLVQDGDEVVTDEMRRDAARYLTGVQRRLQARGLTVESEYPEGPASDAILRRARQLGVDLIAITTHGRAGVDRMLLGSVAEDVLRRAPCPVLLVRVREDR